MSNETRTIKLDSKDIGVVFNSLNDKRNRLRCEGKTTEAVDDVILKVACAPNARGRLRNEAR